ncbi:hypothetical protein PtB15_2B171 [Puccinia triticina]|nr:hypothetical protein PtB15_2B171 [Puccinia triticina]
MLKIGLINRPSLISDPSNHAPSADYPHHQANHQTIASFNFQDQFHFHHHQPHLPDIFSFVDGTRLAPKNSVLGQVEKVIEVIRRRQSPKAIETPQRVHFIIQYAVVLAAVTRAEEVTGG